MELIKIETNNGKQAVSGRELHRFLEVGRDFTTWMKQMIGYGFTKDTDYVVYTENGENLQGGRPSQDYILSLDMAKQICMLQRSDKGMQARAYFIECEKKLQAAQVQALPHDYLSALKALVTSEEAKQEAIAKVEAQNKTIGFLKPKAEITDAFIERGHAVGFRDVAKELKVKENVLRRLLEGNRIAYRQGNRWKPYAKSMERGWMIVKDVMTDRFSVPQALFTMEGKDAIRRLLQKETEKDAETREYTTETGKSLKAAMKSPGMLPKSSTDSQNGDTSHLRAHKSATKGNTRARNKKGSQRGYKAVSATTDNDTVDLLGCLGGNFF